MFDVNSFWIAGTPRVGSMWTSNVVRRVLELKKYSVFPEQAYNSDAPSRFFKERAFNDFSEQNKYVFKSHNLLSPNIPRSKVITNIRNPFYICASFYEFMKTNVEHALSVAMRHEKTINHYQQFNKDKILFLRHEDIENAPVQIVIDISKFINYELNDKEAQVISDELTKKNIKNLISKNDKKIAKLKKINKNVPTDEIVDFGNGIYRSFDKKTGFQSGHISNRGSDDWKSLFSPSEIKLITQNLNPIAKKLGYEVE